MKLPDRLSANVTRFLTVLIACLLGSGISVAVLVDDDQDPATPPKPIITIDLPKLAPVFADVDQQQQADELVDAGADPSVVKGQTGEEEADVDIHEDARDEVPPGVTPQEVSKGQERTETLAQGTLRAPEQPAGAQGYSCPDAYVVNRSGLSGRRVGVALHFTVSGTGSLNAIRGLFNRPSFGASSNYGIEVDGRCQTWVPPSQKAWAQGAANSAYESIEIITFDRSRASWLATPLIKRGILASLVADRLKAIGAPPRRRDPVGCVWDAGVVDHNSLECGNTHWDVGPGFPWDVFMGQVGRAYRGASAVGRVSPLTTKERRTVRGIARPKRSGHSRGYWCQRGRAQRAAIVKAARRSGGGGWKARHRSARQRTLGKSVRAHCR